MGEDRPGRPRCWSHERFARCWQDSLWIEPGGAKDCLGEVVPAGVAPIRAMEDSGVDGGVNERPNHVRKVV